MTREDYSEGEIKTTKGGVTNWSEGSLKYIYETLSN